MSGHPNDNLLKELSLQPRLLRESLDILEGFDFDALQVRLAKEEGVTRDVAAERVYGYKRWLAMQRCHPQVALVPSKAIDLVWHLHILDTRHYHTVCDTLFGGYLHHNPAASSVETEQRRLRHGHSIAEWLWEHYYRESYAAGNATADCDPSCDASSPCQADLR